MSTEVTGDKQRPAHLFKPGQSGNPAGRPRGARNRLQDSFLADLAETWQTHGPEALRRCAVDEPAQFCRIVASLLPKDLHLNVQVDAADFAERFRTAYSLLGNPEPPKPRRSLRVINHEL